ncbi:amidase [Poseidonocella sedimentorum]|uniref:Aspartyl/glutamyl-tRNA(Asn/Gln) amidotransferase subunit A n=1 Tax=Poseidonocella sedimentorum TaxID=871652 RepID=A0A1I6E350_9RHOB|nr:amidase [Poseidonocella sedimentorum]SFR12200.1 aspartyl/glutamyl-tRNA(Asn/Gln) amidotransferase subunit A [Poseidonocella sedimentorum]
MSATLAQIAAARLAGKDAAARMEPALKALAAEPTIVSSVEAATARAQARTLDQLAARGQSAGPLHGVPLAHKDMYDRAGQVTGFGAKTGAGMKASETSTVLARLDAAGQIDMGRLRMSEFAMGPTGHNHHWGIPRNSARAGAISGGSSSGSGAAVGAGLVRAALGSDTGGSIRLPAACNGVVGFKPTQGRVPMTGVMPLSFSQDTVGPLAATVAEARLVLSIIAGPDGRDPICRYAPAMRPRGEALGKGLRIGFASGAVMAPASRAMTAAMGAVRERVSAVARTREVGLDLLTTLGEAANAIAMSEAAAVHADRLARAPESYGDQLRSRLAQAVAIPGFAYVRALQLRSRARAEMMRRVFDEVDLFVMPTLHDVPPLAAEHDVGGGQGVAAMIGKMVHFTRPISFLGFPALSLPVARTADGPLSVQIVGPDWSEDLIADLGEWLEAECSSGG